MEGKPIHIPDVLADPNYTATGYFHAFGYRTIIGVPLLREGVAIGVFAIILDDGGRVLLCHRRDQDLWNLPGGGLESGETPWEALGRAQLGAGLLPGARASFRKAISMDSGDWELWYRLASASGGGERRLAIRQAARLFPRAQLLRGSVRAGTKP